MIDPTVALQTLIRDRLAQHPKIEERISPYNIRGGPIGPHHMPAIVLGPTRVRFLGRASGGQIVAEVRMFLNLWTPEDASTLPEAQYSFWLLSNEGGSATAQIIAGAMLSTLMDAPRSSDFEIDEWDRPELVWSRDPDPAQPFIHGTVALRAVLRWRAD